MHMVAVATDFASSIRSRSAGYSLLMQIEGVQEFRRARLEAAAERAGGKAALGRLLGYRDGAMVGQMLRGERPITEGTVAKLEAKPGFRDWFSRDTGLREPAASYADSIGTHPAEQQVLEDLRILLPRDRARFMGDIHAKAEEMREHERLVLERVGVTGRKERSTSDIHHTPNPGGGVTFTEGAAPKAPTIGKLKRR